MGISSALAQILCGPTSLSTLVLCVVRFSKYSYIILILLPRLLAGSHCLVSLRSWHVLLLLLLLSGVVVGYLLKIGFRFEDCFPEIVFGWSLMGVFCWILVIADSRFERIGKGGFCQCQATVPLRSRVRTKLSEYFLAPSTKITIQVCLCFESMVF